MKKFLCTISILFLGYTSYSQQDHTFLFMPEVGQHIYANPAFTPSYKVSIGLPLISSNYIGLSNTGFTYNDIISRQEDGSLHLTLDKLSGELNEENFLEGNVSADLLHLGIRTSDRFFLSLNATVKSHKSLMYPGDLINFLVAGNAPFIGEQLSISPRVESLSYLEMGVGASYEITDKLTLGGRFKLLGGIENATTQHARLDLMTEADTYHLTVQADASLLTTNFQQEDGEDFDPSNFMSNSGFAVDLGATYQVNDKLQLGLSVLDIGAINWKENTYEYYLDPEVAEYTFKGSPINELFEEGSAPFDAISDTISNNFEFQERRAAAYKTSLPMKSYLTGNYQISRSLSTGAALFLQHYEEQWQTGFSANLAKRFGRVLSTSLSYSVRENSYNNFGAGVSLNLSPIQLYLVSDNLLNAAYHGIADGAINGYINNSNSMNLRFGVNFIFGREKQKEEKEQQEEPSSNNTLTDENSYTSLR